MPLDVVLRRFDAPAEVREFEKGLFEVVHSGGFTIGRATLGDEPESHDPAW